MSLVDTYRATLHTLFTGSTRRILITNEYGFSLITNVFSQKEMLDMQILGVFLLGDVDIFSKFKKHNYEIVFFIEGEDDFTALSNSLSHCKTNVYVHFYTPITKLIADKLLIFDVEHLVKNITSTPLAFLPVSNYVAVSDKTNIFPIMGKMPNKIVTSDSKITDNGQLLNEISSKLEECKNNCTLYERGHSTSNTLLIAVPRSYDLVTPMIIPWTYEALARYLKLSLDNSTGHCSDKFFSDNRFEHYEDALRNIKKESEDMKKKYGNGANNMSQSFEANDVNKMIQKHVDLLTRIKSSIEENNILQQSELEQRALVRDLSNANKELFLKNYKRVAETIFSSDKMTFNSNVPIYYQNVPKIRTLIESYLNAKGPQYTSIYIYVKDYICYEEVAEVEKFNNFSRIKIYLLSDSILDRWCYLGFVNKQIGKTTFRINKPTTIKEREITINIDVSQTPEITSLDQINDKITKLETFKKNIFDEEKEKEYERMYIEVVNSLSSEYEKFKNPKKNMNQLEQNNRSMKLLKLESIASRFKSLEYKQKEDKKKIRTSIDSLFDDLEANYSTSQSQTLELENYDNVMTERLIDQRGEQITNIRKGVHEVQSLYIDLHRELERQNLMLDQISVSLIKSADLTKSGAQHLTTANNYDKQTTGWKQKIVVGLVLVNALIWTGVGLTFGLTKH